MSSEAINIPPKPDKYSSLRLGELIDAVSEDCVWLLRNHYRDSTEGYFCHIHDRRVEFVKGVAIGGISCKETSVSPEEAFRQALRAYEKAINK